MQANLKEDKKFLAELTQPYKKQNFDMSKQMCMSYI